MVILNDVFSTIDKAKEAINRYILNKEESYKIYKSDSRRHIVVCKDFVCKFKIKASLLIKKKVVIIIFIAHSYSFVTYYKNKQFLALWYLKDYYKVSLINDRSLTPAQIQTTERLRFNNNINYQQVYRLKQVLLDKIDGNKTDSFVLFSAYIQWLENSDSLNQA